MTPARAKLLQSVIRRRPKAVLKRAFAAIRANDDAALLSALRPKKRPLTRRGDPLVRELDQILKPVVGPAREKADLLVAHFATRRRQMNFEPRSLSDAVRRLRAASLSEAQIRAGAKKMMRELAELYGGPEAVV